MEELHGQIPILLFHHLQVLTLFMHAMLLYMVVILTWDRLPLMLQALLLQQLQVMFVRIVLHNLLSFSLLPLERAPLINGKVLRQEQIPGPILPVKQV